jgi:release factor glutamine methyltransferase
MMSLSERLSRAGFVAADEEAAELVQCAGGDSSTLELLVERRLRGEPLAWITGHTVFCDLVVAVHPGVYVPRWQSEMLAQRAVARLSRRASAVEVCAGSGALAAVLARDRPEAEVVATDLDPRAVRCARSNGVRCLQGDLFDPLGTEWRGRVDLVVGVVPYVPTEALAFLPHDTFSFESLLSYDGGKGGTTFLYRVIDQVRDFLVPGGALLLELGGDQGEAVTERLGQRGFCDIELLVDAEGDVRGVEATVA